MSFNVAVGICLAYAGLLFAVAFWAERRARRGRHGWLGSAWIYTLSLSIYCTAWTFYGAVGFAARSGLEFLTIYLGPTLVLVGWWLVLRKLVEIGHVHRVTSIADLISARYGKSPWLGGLVTAIAVIGTTPYIALQLQSVTQSFGVFAAPGAWPGPGRQTTAIWIAIGLAAFAMLFGTRSLHARERHHGIVAAIALEGLVKLIAIVALGVFVVWGVGGGPGPILDRIDASALAAGPPDASRWLTLIALSAAAFLCLPRMFHVVVVENTDARHLATASWAFPLYLLLISLFVLPIAVVGAEILPEGANPDLYVLTLPLALDRDGLAMLTFIGGFSSATSMVVVAAIALATMISNHVVIPLWLGARGGAGAGDLRGVVIAARRLSIAGILALAYGYWLLTDGSSSLAATGLIAFAGMAQLLPALLGGIFWRGATLSGAAAGVVTGFAVWAWTLALPSFGPGAVLSEAVMAAGPFGVAWLRPEALLGTGGLDPLVHATFWSLTLNATAFCAVSLISFPGPVERLQGAQFVNVFDLGAGGRGWTRGGVEAEELLVLAQRILGGVRAQALFREAAEDQGKAGMLPDPTPAFVDHLERELAGSVGAATAHAMIGQVAASASVSVGDLMAVADEAAQIMEHSSQLEAKSRELARTAGQLREANAKLTALSIQKDAFLSQISHELRTPMTSIRAFSEILMAGEEGGPPLTAEERQRYASIIHDEAERLTRLLGALLDLSTLEQGAAPVAAEPVILRALIDRAIAATTALSEDVVFEFDRVEPDENVVLTTDADRLAQVFINLVANARKYCDASAPRLSIRVRRGDGDLSVDFIDNGSGVPAASQALIFEKFARLPDHGATGGAGLGLAICREIMARLGGSVAYLPGQGGGAFRVVLPAGRAVRAA